MRRKAERFINIHRDKESGALSPAAQDWQSMAEQHESDSRVNLTYGLKGEAAEKALAETLAKGIYDVTMYPYDRVQGGKDDLQAIDKIHRVNFIQHIESSLASGHYSKTKPFKMLDVGGGSGKFADQIKQRFGDLVDVATTGLRKFPAKMSRAQGKLPNKYLKWRSILELSKYPEFDLIIDTYGEAFYTRQYRIEEFFGSSQATKDRLHNYLTAVTTKLKVGGYAYIAPMPYQADHLWEVKSLTKRIEASSALADYELVFTFLDSDMPYSGSMKVYKRPRKRER